MLLRFMISFGLCFSAICLGQVATTPPNNKEVAILGALLQRAADIHPDVTLNAREEDGAISLLRLDSAGASAFRSAARAFSAKLRQLRASELSIASDASRGLTDADRAKIALLLKERDQMLNASAAKLFAAASQETLALLRRIVDGK